MANYCCKCGYKVDTDWQYCPKCGAELPVIEMIDEITPNKLESQIITSVIKPVKSPEPVREKNHPTLPRKIDKQIFEGRLKEYRLQKAQEEKKSPAYIFENKALNELSEARNRILLKQDLYDIKYWAEYRINKYGDDIIDILNQLDQNYIP